MATSPHQFRQITRRRVLGGGCAIACTCQVPFVSAALATSALKEFRHGRVQLAPGPLLTQFEQQQRLFLSIDDDKLLKPFRVRAGLAAPGADMGGWYDDSKDFLADPKDWSTANWHGFIPGHSFGQYLSGLARGFAITGNEEAKRKVTGLVNKYAEAISPRFFDDYNLPAYTYDKLVVGLIDAFHFAGVTEASDALSRLTDVALPFLPEKALTREERRARPYKREAQIWDEPYTLPENLFLAWHRGMGERYHALALRYVADDSLFDSLALGKSPFKGKHAYSHVNALSSAIQAHLATGDDKYLAAARNGFSFVQAQSFATGGWGPNEGLLASNDTQSLFNFLESTHQSFETPCGAYAHFKITRSLLRLTKDSRYGDSMERVLYNTILGAKPTLPDGKTFYYADYNRHAHKFYREPDSWPCCSGTFIQLTADYGISAYLFDERDLYVNLFVPSQVSATLAGADVKVTQSTEYPLTSLTRLQVEVARPTAFSVRLRIPAWAGAATQIRVNGKVARGTVKPGTFATLDRTWKAGDVVEISFDMGLRLEALNEAHPEMVAVMTGPLVLFPIETSEQAFTREELLNAKRSAKDEWSVAAKPRTITLKPFMAIGDEEYRLYSELRTST